jgi:transposase
MRACAHQRFGRCRGAAAGFQAFPSAMIIDLPVRPGLRILVTARPVDFRRGMDSLSSLVKQTLAIDPFAGDVFVFRAKRAQHATFYVRFAVCEDRLSLASAVWSYAPGIALPAR